MEIMSVLKLFPSNLIYTFISKYSFIYMYVCVCLDVMYKILKLEMIKVQGALLKISLKLVMFYNFANNNNKNAVASF